MIEKFLEKFLPQITERLNENEEVGKALIEALAVLDNYATINNVQFTDEQVNSMLGIVPEPEPEPNADIPAEIIQAEENAWSWRFKTQDEIKEEFKSWRGEWGSKDRDYLFGQPIPRTPETEEFIKEVILPQEPLVKVNTETLFGISSPKGKNRWGIDFVMITDKPLPIVTWNWRFKTKEELIGDYGANWRGSWGSDARDYLFGQPIPRTPETEEFIEEVIIPQEPVLDVDTETLFGISSPTSENWWGIDYMMITDKPLPKTAWNWRFKTAEEFKDEYGDDWESELGRESGLVWVNPNMNYLLGQKLEQNLYTEELISTLKDDFLVSDYVEVSRLGIYTRNVNESWTVSWSMFTNKPLPTAVTPSTQKGWNWRFKTEQEFIDENGGALDWRDLVAGQWSPRMDYLLGQRIQENFNSKSDIEYLENQPKGKYIDTADWGIDADKLGVVNPDNKWSINMTMLTQDPLPTAAAPVKTEPKKRGRKPKGTATAWNWRFKTEEEFKEEYGDDWREEADWSVHGGMDYLLGEEIAETSNSRDVISLLKKGINSNTINTQRELGISSGDDDDWILNFNLLINKPLPKVILTRGQPLTQPINTAWTWRFKTEQELQQEWGLNRWKIKVAWNDSGKMDYLLGKPIIESDLSKQFIEDLLKSSAVVVDTNNNLGIDSGSRNTWTISEELVTNKPLPTAAAPAKSEPKKRGRKPKSELPEIDLGGLEDIGDIDIDDIDFDNLVI